MKPNDDEYYKNNPIAFFEDCLKEYFEKVTAHQLALIDRYKVKIEGMFKDAKSK